jgi:hypothetical protein
MDWATSDSVAPLAISIVTAVCAASSVNADPLTAPKRMVSEPAPTGVVAASKADVVSVWLFASARTSRL